jgi:hypothetical protein
VTTIVTMTLSMPAKNRDLCEPSRIIREHLKKLLSVVALAAAALGPMSASAAPSPSPALATLLVPPPSGYVAVSTGTFHGRFDATAYAAQYGSKTLEAGLTLIHDGFVDGYGMTWLQRSTGRALIEFVIAFEGGRGAKSWLGYEETSDKNGPGYKHSNSLTGIDTYYGVHLILTSPAVFVDAFSLVKGNDMFGVGFVSAKDNVLKLATSQTKAQYSSAPVETIPKSQWPENVPSQRPLVNTFGAVVGAVLALVVIAGVVRLVLSRRRRT